MKTLVKLAIIYIFIHGFHFVNAQCVQCSGTIVTGETASAIGINNTASGKASFAGGIYSEAIEKYTLAFGDSAKAWSRNGIALGKNASVFGPYSFGVGENVKTMITSSMVIGSGFDDYNPLVNNISKSLMIGFYSNKPTLFIGGATGNGLTGKIGIGDVTDPLAKLHIKADDDEVEPLLFMEPYTFTGGESAKLRLGTMDYGISSGTGKLYFVTGGNYVFNSANAKVGIGTLEPKARLHVNGNVYLDGEGSGLVLESPDGQCWKVTVGNDGSLSSTTVDCEALDVIGQSYPSSTGNIMIFPNPTTGELTIDCRESFQGFVSLRDMTGALILQKAITTGINSIDLSHLHEGYYLVSVTDGDDNVIRTEKILKQQGF